MDAASLKRHRESIDLQKRVQAMRTSLTETDLLDESVRSQLLRSALSRILAFTAQTQIESRAPIISLDSIVSLIAVMDRNQGTASPPRSFLVFEIIRKVFHPSEEIANPAGETIAEEHPFGMICREAGSNISLALALLRRVFPEKGSFCSYIFGTRSTKSAVHNWDMSPNPSTWKSPTTSFSPTSTLSVSPFPLFNGLDRRVEETEDLSCSSDLVSLLTQCPRVPDEVFVYMITSFSQTAKQLLDDFSVKVLVALMKLPSLVPRSLAAMLGLSKSYQNNNNSNNNTNGGSTSSASNVWIQAMIELLRSSPSIQHYLESFLLQDDPNSHLAHTLQQFAAFHDGVFVLPPIAEDAVVQRAGQFTLVTPETAMQRARNNRQKPILEQLPQLSRVLPLVALTAVQIQALPRLLESLGSLESMAIDAKIQLVSRSAHVLF